MIIYPSNFQHVSEDLLGLVRRAEIKKIVFDMGAFKLYGEDGFPAEFYHNCWNIVGYHVCSFISEVWRNPVIIKDINNTLLVLTPKVDKLEFVFQLRSISLCNVIYQIIAKVIVLRIKPFLNDLISPFQSSSIMGLVIHHTVIIALEMFHSMKKMKGKNISFMAIKIDLEKRYGRLN